LTIRHQHKPLQADAAGKTKQGDGGGDGHEGDRKPLLSHDDATTN